MKRPVLIFLFLFLTLLVANSCKKPAGEGGNSRIRGKVWTKKWDKYFTQILYEYPGANIDIYIIYGDNISYGKSIKTNYNGEFEFQYLRKGKYKIYAYSYEKQDTVTLSGLNTILVEAEITKNKSIVDVGTLTVKR